MGSEFALDLYGLKTQYLIERVYTNVIGASVLVLLHAYYWL